MAEYWKRKSNNIVIRDLGLAFFCVAKNANTSVKRLLMQYGELEYVSAEEIAGLGIATFAICRNPWDRLYSCWRNKIMEKSGTHLRETLRLKRKAPFNVFVEKVCAQDDADADYHVASQTREMFHDGKYLLDGFGGVMRFENLSDDWNMIQEWFMDYHDIDLPMLDHLNRSRGADYKEAYRKHKRLISLVRDRYRKDVELFGYEF